MERNLKLIKCGRSLDVDPERYVPGNVVAVYEDERWRTTIYRRGDRFFRKVVYKSPAHAWEILKDILDQCGTVDRKELSLLQYLASKGP